MIFHPGQQATLAGRAEFEGVGLHTGEPCSVAVHDAPAGSGISFRVGGQCVPAVPESVVDTSRGTTLGCDGARVVCVEHLMAALAGAGIDNAVCEVRGPELPAMDGSARGYAEGLLAAGIAAQGAERRVFGLSGVECVSRGATLLAGTPSGSFEARYLLRYDHRLIGLEFLCFKGGREEFVSGIAPARTFGLASEAEQLRQMGLARGASTDNAVIVYDDEVKPRLRFADEFVRHKILDMLGDLALAGGAIQGTVFGIATGHTANIEMAKRLRKE